MTPLQAERFSHEVIVRCAGELESGDGGRVQERAMAEAETMLVGWRSARRTPLAAAA
jgi:hypothetical protein